jgi:hypothetical protein
MGTRTVSRDEIIGDGPERLTDKVYRAIEWVVEDISNIALEGVTPAFDLEGVDRFQLIFVNLGPAGEGAGLEDMEVRVGPDLDENGDITSNYLDILGSELVLQTEPQIPDIRTLSPGESAIMVSTAAMGNKLQVWMKSNDNKDPQTVSGGFRLYYWR